MRFVRRLVLVTLIIALAPSISSGATLAEAFARLPTFTDLAISPGGQFLAARVNVDNQFAIRVYDISGSGLDSIYGLAETDEMAVDWFRWVTPERLLLSVGFAGVRGSRVEVQTEERRLLSLHAGRKELLPLFRTHRSEIPVQIQDRVVSFLPDDPEHILVQYPVDDPSRPGVYSVDVNKQGGHKLVVKGRFGVRRWMADASGDVRLGSGLVSDGMEPFLIMRQKDEKKWVNFSHRVIDEGVDFIPAGFSQEPNKIFVISSHEGDPSGLYTFDIVKDEFSELIFKHPTVDIHDVTLDQRTGELRSVNFIEDDVETMRFSTLPIQDNLDALREQLSDRTLRTRSISEDGNFAVIDSQSPTDAGQFLLFDRVANRLKALPPQYPALAGVDLGRTFVSEYAARDGLVIPAFITLPPGLQSLDEARDLPFVVHPHGGPSSRDFLRFSFRTQFLVALGYGVLQMNFRGSEGYGRAFKDAGNREWGQAMQDDITDGANWLVETGVANPDQLAIMGGSYGGYAALMGAVKTPDLYRCAVSFAGVSDLLDLIKLERRFVGGSYGTRFIGDLWKDRKMLRENSPAQRADAIQVPILLMHGDADNVVDLAQSEKMADALRKNDKEFELFVFENGDHYLSLYSNRVQYLTQVERFLNKCLNQ